MLKTPLNSFHHEHKGHMVEFAGWEMAMYYAGLTQEHHQVRNSGGIFDVSHMGRVKMAGRHARKLLERICTRRISDMELGQCRYSLVCNEEGGVKDDVIVYDGTGRHQAVSCALHLAEHGRDVARDTFGDRCDHVGGGDHWRRRYCPRHRHC